MTFSGFFDQLGNLDWLAIILGTVAAMVVGFVWYGPLLGKLWASKSGVGMGSGNDPVKLALTAAYFFVFNIALQYLGVIVNDFDIEHALVAGIVVGVLTIGPALYSNVVWAKKHMTVFFIDIGHWAVATAVCVLVQGLVV